MLRPLTLIHKIPLKFPTYYEGEGGKEKRVQVSVVWLLLLRNVVVFVVTLI